MVSRWPLNLSVITNRSDKFSRLPALTRFTINPRGHNSISLHVGQTLPFITFLIEVPGLMGSKVMHGVQRHSLGFLEAACAVNREDNI
jgi:hypothetical protein